MAEWRISVNNTDKKGCLSVQDLVVEYRSGGETVQAVNHISFDLPGGRSLGLVGETGAGKTTTAKSIMRILPDHATQKVCGVIEYDGTDILKISEAEMQKIRGGKISMIFQDPMTALNPVKTVGDQIAEGLMVHQGLDKSGARAKAIEMLQTVGISEDRVDEYPHQFSGGMKQRVVIAIALACNPELIIADEPTTALDVTIQAQVLELIKKLQEQRGTSMILITHDLGVVAQVCDDVAIVYAGEIVEKGTLEEIYDHPMHPYTEGLFGAIPELTRDTHRLSPVPGLPPDPTALPTGCYFAPRCPYATDLCTEKHFDLEKVGGSHYVRCRKKEQEG
ncbi:MAG: ABC transporter ATP-binding protein [Lachnospiraceae bacterium]|nr:ABC transporter ATP-binding protein [Lachnospiraceae bacterium]